MATVTSHKQSGGHVWPNWPRTLRNTAAYLEKSKREAPAGAAWDRRVERKGCARMVCTPPVLDKAKRCVHVGPVETVDGVTTKETPPQKME